MPEYVVFVLILLALFEWQMILSREKMANGDSKQIKHSLFLSVQTKDILLL